MPPPSAPATPESYTWPLITPAIAIVPQVAVPPHDRIGPVLTVPIIEVIAFLGMLAIAAKPGPVPRGARPVILALFGFLIGANTAAAVRLVILTLGDAHNVDGAPLSAARLLITATTALATNIVTFALLYWQIDGGGPVGRVTTPAPYPDFQFPQTQSSGLAPPGWHPQFADHLYLAFTNVVAFSPTDTMPLTTRAKGLMALQSVIALGVLVVVLSRVINILPS